jgi:hypothetical protein
MSKAQIEYHLKCRNAYLQLADAENEILETLAPQEVKDGKLAVLETIFTCLTFEAHKGERLGDYDIAHAKNNTQAQFDHAFNILKAANSSINHRYHGPNYVYSFWLYSQAIYRQKLTK